jgi:PASTA domain
MLASDPADRPGAGDCAQLLSGAQFAVPVAGGRVRRRFLPADTDPGEPGLGLVTDAAGEDPVAASATRPSGARATAGRPWRPRRAVLATGTAALLVLGGSVTAWRLSASSQPSELAVRSSVTSPPVTAAGAKHPTASAPGSRSAPSSAAASPSRYRSAAPAGAPSAPPASSRTASPTSSPAKSPVSTRAPSPTASASPSSTPSLVKIPDVIGLTFARATTKLEKHGFIVVAKHARVGQVVTATDPSGAAPAGSIVTVVYGTGKLL